MKKVIFISILFVLCFTTYAQTPKLDDFGMTVTEVKEKYSYISNVKYSNETKFLMAVDNGKMYCYQFKDADKCDGMLICCNNDDSFLRTLVDMFEKADGKALLADQKRTVKNSKGDIINVEIKKDEELSGLTFAFAIYLQKIGNSNEPIQPINP